MFCVQIVGVDERVFAGVGGGEGDGAPRGRAQLVHVDLECLAQRVESAVVPDVGRHEVELEVGVEGVSGSDNIAEGEVGCSDIFYLTVNLERGKILVT